MKNDKTLNWIIDCLKDTGRIDVIKVQDILFNDQSKEDNLNFISFGEDGNGQTRRFENSIALAKVVLQTVDWLNGKEGKEWMRKRGEVWTNEEIGKHVFGWQKSFLYKMLRVAKLNDTVIINYNKYCKESSSKNEKHERSIAGLLKFAKTGVF